MTTTDSHTTTKTRPPTSPPTSENEGVLGDNHKYTPRIRQYANEVVYGSAWPISAIDLSWIIFETRTRAKRRNGVCTRKGEHIVIGVSEHVIRNAGFNAAKNVIRHELIHAWQHQHTNHSPIHPEPNIRLSHIEPGHSDDAWGYWSKQLNVKRTNSYYSKSITQYKYAMRCPECGNLIGKHRLCKSVRQATLGDVLCADCQEPMLVIRPSEPNIAFKRPSNIPNKFFLDEFLREFVEGSNRHTTRIDR